MQHIDELIQLAEKHQLAVKQQQHYLCMCIFIDIYSTKSFTWIIKNNYFINCIQHKVADAFSVTLKRVKFRLFKQIEKVDKHHFSILVVDPVYAPEGISFLLE